MRIILLTCAFLFAASPAFAGPGAAEGKKSAAPASAKNVAAQQGKAADRKARPALAKGQTAWPKKLRHRMSRYARFGRSLDRAGDLQEQVRANMARTRVKDVQGDRIEFARAKLSQRNRFASRNAVLARKRGIESDQRERQLSRLTRTRSRADFRRQMLIPAHELAELKLYKRDYAKFGSPLENSGLRMADKRRSERGADADERKQDWRNKGRDRSDRDDPYLRSRENGERESDRETDRHADRDSERDSEREADREGESEDRDAEREGERDSEREAEREEDAEERSEDAETRSEERTDERTDDRADEKTIRQAEERRDE